jgi:exodeoxyribonuclease V alpha subunit
MFKKVINICKYHKCKLILVGDIHQLQPIACGTPFIQLFKCGIYVDNITNLTEIKRQKGILSENIVKINRELLTSDDFDGKSMIFIEETNFSTTNIKKIINKIHIDENIKSANPERIQYISAQYSKNGGVTQMNTILKKIFNPNGIDINCRFNPNNLTEQDLVYRKENDYTDPKLLRVNGDIGHIISADNKHAFIKYINNGGTEKISVNELAITFDLFYSCTVHKMQGSQTDIIVIIMPPEHDFMWSSNPDSKELLYTAISRCKEKCYIIGSKQLFIKAQVSHSDTAGKITKFMREFNEFEFN